MIYTDSKYIDQTLKKRKRDAHKGDFGRLLIFAGSPGMAGAAVLCGKAAIKSGAGLVRFLLSSFDSALLPVLQASVPEATCIEFDPSMDFSEYSAICAGCGLSFPETSEKLFPIISKISFIIDNYNGPLVLDADALNILAASSELKEKAVSSKASIILTPHIGEAKRLIGKNVSIISWEERKKAALSISQMFNAVTVLKGSGTLVAKFFDPSYPDPVVYENTTGNPGMASGGSGDVLTGVIAALSAQGYDPLAAARMGVFFSWKSRRSCSKRDWRDLNVGF